jgi:FdhE protein
MVAAAARQSKWDERIARARALATVRPAAAELLSFYAALAEFQQSLAGDANARRDHASRLGDIDRIVAALQAFVSWLPHTVPHPIDALDDMSKISSDRWNGLVQSYMASSGWAPDDRELLPGVVDDVLAMPFVSASTDDDRLVRFAVEAVLQAFAEDLAIRAAPRLGSDTSLRCPRCAVLPVAAVLRDAGQGAKRSLLCALCLNEWDCLRIVCPACGEREFERLPVYTAEQFTHVRIDACDRCRHYMKTIDLTKDGLAVPVVDDIASVSLDLWARGREYVRLKRNVLGL